MMSAASMGLPKPANAVSVQGWVPALTVHPSGYDTVRPYRSDVCVPVSGAAVGEGTLGSTLGVTVGVTTGVGLGLDSPPGPFVPGRSALRPNAPMAITATAAMASLVVLLMVGNLHGTRTSTRRCDVVSMVASAFPSTRSGARRLPSLS